MKTGFQALKLALAGFIVPFMFVYNPSMMMIDVSQAAVTAREFPLPPWWTILSVTVTSTIGVISLSAAVEGYFKTMMSPLLRVILAAGGLMLIIPELVTDVVGIVLVGIVLTLNVLMAKREQTARPAA